MHSFVIKYTSYPYRSAGPLGRETPYAADDVSRFIGLGEEHGGRVKPLQAIVEERREAGHHNQDNRGVIDSGVQRDVNAVHVAGHLNVCEQDIEKQSPDKQQSRLIATWSIRS